MISSTDSNKQTPSHHKNRKSQGNKSIDSRLHISLYNIYIYIYIYIYIQKIAHDIPLISTFCALARHSHDGATGQDGRNDAGSIGCGHGFTATEPWNHGL